uniref:Uncharacterized protein n=1 Tax=Ascaris lumbricoides TaxID=6252 RepID=A0A0M3I1W1_ASCLU
MQLSRGSDLRSERARRSSAKSTVALSDIIQAQSPQSSPKAHLSGAQLPHSGAIEMQNMPLNEVAAPQHERSSVPPGYSRPPQLSAEFFVPSAAGFDAPTAVSCIILSIDKPKF